MNIAIIGGGAAGFFAAITCKTHNPQAGIVICEKSGKLLSKVKVSGGGRCNVTHACFNNSQLSKNYPRGSKQLKKAFTHFNPQNTIDWFESRGVPLKTEKDNRIFPVSDNSQSIIDCLTGEANRLGVEILLHSTVTNIELCDKGFELTVNGKTIIVDKVIVATGGSPKLEGFDWLRKLGHSIISPVPSLFTFNMPSEKIRELPGVSVEHVLARVQGTSLKAQGPLLITHWGMSGPAILKLSAFGARLLHDMNYRFVVQVNWLGDINEEQAREHLLESAEVLEKRKAQNANPFELPGRLWLFLLGKAGIDVNQPWGQLGKKNKNRLLNTLLNDEYQAEGKTTFKEEFVTCGGISLDDIDFNTMESRKCPGLYFAGEVMDVDGVTGGFNFQAAWTTGYIAGTEVINK